MAEDRVPTPTTATQIETIQPVTLAEAGFSAAEYARLLVLLRSLGPEDWAKAPDCPLWDVRAMSGHCVAVMGHFGSLLGRMRAATR